MSAQIAAGRIPKTGRLPRGEGYHCPGQSGGDPPLKARAKICLTGVGAERMDSAMAVKGPTGGVKRLPLVALSVLSAATAFSGALIVAPSALASSACVEYVVVPSCQPQPDPNPGGSPGGSTPLVVAGSGGPSDAAVVKLPAGASVAAPTGTLPFTGYPANGLILLILALIALALLIRMLLAIDKRLRASEE